MVIHAMQSHSIGRGTTDVGSCQVLIVSHHVRHSCFHLFLSINLHSSQLQGPPKRDHVDKGID